VGKQIIGLLPSEQECLYYLVINSQDLGAANWIGWTIDGVDVYSSGYVFYNNNLGGQSLVISYIGTQISRVTLDDGFGNLYPFDVRKVTEFGGSCENVCYQAEFDYGYILYYIDYFQLGGATPTGSATIRIDNQTVLQDYINNFLGTVDADVTSIWNGSRYVVTINNAYNLGGLVFDDGFGNLTTFNVLPCQITPPNPVPLTLLTLYPGASAAYSVRKLSSTYSGSALRVRRSSDNTEQDIGFDGLDLDIAALANFVGPDSGFVTKWYDQSGNNNDSFNTVGVTQPRLVNGGVIEVQNSKPSVRFLGAFGQELVLTNTLNINTSWSCYSVLSRASTSDSIASICNNTTAGYSILLTSNLNYVWYTNTLRQSTNSLTNLNLYSVYNNDTNIYINNVANATSLTLTLAGNNFNRIGKRGNTNPQGYISEIIFYPTSQLSNNTGINTNITTYYSI
jgi:hypothetical protein